MADPTTPVEPEKPGFLQRAGAQAETAARSFNRAVFGDAYDYVVGKIRGTDEIQRTRDLQAQHPTAASLGTGTGYAGIIAGSVVGATELAAAARVAGAARGGSRLVNAVDEAGPVKLPGEEPVVVEPTAPPPAAATEAARPVEPPAENPAAAAAATPAEPAAAVRPAEEAPTAARPAEEPAAGGKGPWGERSPAAAERPMVTVAEVRPVIAAGVTALATPSVPSAPQAQAVVAPSPGHKPRPPKLRTQHARTEGPSPDTAALNQAALAAGRARAGLKPEGPGAAPLLATAVPHGKDGADYKRTHQGKPDAHWGKEAHTALNTHFKPPTP